MDNHDPQLYHNSSPSSYPLTTSLCRPATPPDLISDLFQLQFLDQPLDVILDLRQLPLELVDIHIPPNPYAISISWPGAPTCTLETPNVAGREDILSWPDLFLDDSLVAQVDRFAAETESRNIALDQPHRRPFWPTDSWRTSAETRSRTPSSTSTLAGHTHTWISTKPSEVSFHSTVRKLISPTRRSTKDRQRPDLNTSVGALSGKTSIDDTTTNRQHHVARVEAHTSSSYDGCVWRKYGEKKIKNRKFPRNYYKCAQVGCSAKKQIERSSEREEYVILTYVGRHSHNV